MNILETRGLTKTFGGLTAVDALDLEIAPCEIRAIIGPNGSGKTTTINVISGVYTPDAGQILLEGEPITGKPPHVITATGLARTFQNVRLLKKITVLDNVLVGGHHRFRSSIWQVLGKTKGQREEEEQGVQEAMELLEFIGLDHRSHHLAGSLPYAQQKMVEIARALAAKPRVLLLDEPAAGMNNQEILFLDEIIRQIRAKGITVILIEHVMDLVRGLVDRVTVLNYGRKIAEGTFDEIERDPEVITAYLGKGAKTIAGNQ